MLLAFIGMWFITSRNSNPAVVTYQMLFFFIGETGLGKSEFKQILKELFGKHLVKQVDLQVWGKRFTKSLISAGIHKVVVTDEKAKGIDQESLQMFCEQKDRPEAEVKHKGLQGVTNIPCVFLTNDWGEGGQPITGQFLRRSLVIDGNAHLNMKEFVEIPSELIKKTGEVVP